MDTYKKKYDEALERAKSFKTPELCDVAEYIFPELKESEDEKIRKELITHCRNTRCVTEEGAERIAKWIDWLEKQGKEKPADKVETKFKVGDWVIDKQNIVHQISNVIENVTYHTYGYDIVGGGYFNDNTEGVRLWTIQNAKDGDVLACNEEILLFKSYSVQNRISLYCWYNGQTNNFHNKEVTDTLLTTRNKIYPATKEQRDLLFQKMHEAGYEWDAEKKELKKIEDEEYDGEDYGIDSLFHAQRILEKTLGKVDGYQTDDGILSHQCAITAVKKLYEQKPAWSEEDREYMESLLDIINGTPSLTPSEVECHKDWLKNLKQRIGGEQ